MRLILKASYGDDLIRKQVINKRGHRTTVWVKVHDKDKKKLYPEVTKPIKVKEMEFDRVKMEIPKEKAISNINKFTGGTRSEDLSPLIEIHLMITDQEYSNKEIKDKVNKWIEKHRIINDEMIDSIRTLQDDILYVPGSLSEGENKGYTYPVNLGGSQGTLTTTFIIESEPPLEMGSGDDIHY